MSKNCKTLKREKLQLCLSHKSSEGQNTSWDKKYYKNYFGRELWSSGYGRSLVRTPTPYTGWTFFTGIFVVKIVMFLWKDETKEKEAGVGPFFKKYCKGISRPGNYSSCSPSQKRNLIDYGCFDIQVITQKFDNRLPTPEKLNEICFLFYFKKLFGHFLQRFWRIFKRQRARWIELKQKFESHDHISLPPWTITPLNFATKWRYIQ